ncbi:unnamed protein product [Durusdinium trenchii]|uniref:UTP-monosaccharide-1-phosphate uridylyltransferase n=1 Tax=Durusdinium trenchii TaxID=1381693 RepID=A0ABP0Q0R7_9DINO
MAELLVSAGQREVFSAWEPAGTHDAEKQTFFEQIGTLDRNYPGGIGCYLQNARSLLQEAAKGENPLEGWSPSVPKDGFQPEVGSQAYMEYEKLGRQEVQNCCFVIPAGGLGERLGFSGVKFALPVELVTGSCVLEVYCAYLQAFQRLAEEDDPSAQRCQLPLVIMASGDTEAGIKALLKSNKYYGLEPGQVTVLLQEKVGALANSNALLSMEGPYKVATKPHGHGDVHFLLHKSGLARRWQTEGKKWILFFQDTNTLYLTTFLCSLGVSAKHCLLANVVTMPRKAKEAVGSIARLTHTDGHSIVANVEYNQLEPLLRATGHDGDVNGPDGFSPYPGNTNELIFALPEYLSELETNGGQMPEFINPKYTDQTRSMFKSPTRLECMMQDFLRLLKADAKVGFTRYPLTFGYFPCKNDIATAARLASQGTPPHGAASAEAAVYDANCTMLRILGGFSGRPRRATLERSSLEIRGDVYLGELTLDGALRIVAGPGVTLHIPKLNVHNKGQDFVGLTDDEQAGAATEDLCIRGYKLVTQDLERIEVTEAGCYTYSEDRTLSKRE